MPSRTTSLPPLKPLFTNLIPWIQLTRVSKFAGTMLIFWPYVWSLTIAARVLRLSIPDYILRLISGFIGASLLHRNRQYCHVSLYHFNFSPGGGCIWNDILDRKIDRLVERTKNRPLAAGTISVPGALVFLAIHLAILTRMIWSLDEFAFRYGIMSIVFFPGVYPLMKRITYWPQAWLGIAMNTGGPMAWLSLAQDLPVSIMILFAGTWAWTIWYDTIYACQDKRDDVKAGVKSTALLFGTWIKPILYLFASALVASLCIVGVMNGMGIYYWGISIAGGALFLTKDMYDADLDSPKACWKTFHRNGFIFGSLVWAGAFADYLASLYRVAR